MKNAVRTISLAMFTLAGVEAAGHLKACGLCKPGEDKAGASREACVVNSLDANKDCSACTTNDDGTPKAGASWCASSTTTIKVANPSCAACDFDSESKWCLNVMGGGPTCAKKSITNFKCDNNTPVVTQASACPKDTDSEVKGPAKCLAKDSKEKCWKDSEVTDFLQCPKSVDASTKITAPAKLEGCDACVLAKVANPSCAACDFDSESKWCLNVMGGGPTCAKKSVTNFKCDNNTPVVTQASACPKDTDVARTWEGTKDVKDDACATCVNSEIAGKVANPSCAACDFDSESKWCLNVMGGGPTCAKKSITNFKCDNNTPVVTQASACPKDTDGKIPQVWCKDKTTEKCQTKCDGASITKATVAQCLKKEKYTEPYKFCTKKKTGDTTPVCGHDTADAKFTCEGRVASAEANQCLKGYDFLTRVATMATKDTCGKDTTYNNGVWTKKSCDWIKGKIPKIPKADTCPATLKTLGAGCCKSSAPPAPPQDNKNKNGTKASSGSMVHPSVGAGIGAGIMALVAGLV